MKLLKHIFNYFFKTPPIKEGQKRDNSIKEWEVLKRRYCFDKHYRTIQFDSGWSHYKYYNTELAGKDALRDLRRSIYNTREYPLSKWDKRNRIRSTINIYRYKLIRRENNQDKGSRESN